MFKAQRFFLALLLFAILTLLPINACAAQKNPIPKGIQSLAPRGTVTDNVSFRIVFKNPIVQKSSVGKSFGTSDNLFPFTVQPQIQAEGKWINERTFTAHLLAPLKNATSYTATFRNNLKDRRGSKISGSFEFQTESLSPGDIKASMGRDGRAYFDMNFNMRVDPARLKGFLSVLNPKGLEVPYKINGALPGKNIRISVPNERSPQRQIFTIKIASGMKSSEGDLGITDDYSQRVVLDPEFNVDSLTGEENQIRAYFNFPVDPETAKSFIKIEPDVEKFALTSGWNDSFFYIRSETFKPRNRFIITFKKGLPSKNGLALKKDFKQAVIMPDLDSEVSLPASGSYLAALDEGLVPIELRNVKKLKLDLWRLYENNIPYAVKGDYDEFPKDLARRVFTNEIDLTSLPLNERVKRTIPINEIASGERGLFLLTARDSEKGYWDEAEQILNLSNIGVVARVWEDGILIWANYLTESNSVRDAEVKIFSANNQLLASGTTNSGGVFYFENGKDWDEELQPAIAVVSKTDENNITDLTYVQLNRNLLNRETFDTAGRAWIKSGYDAAIISPRDIYRTGENAAFKAFVRNKNIDIPEAFPVIFIVKDTLDRKVKQENITLNEFGSAVFKIDLPSNALTGLWKVLLAIPGKENEPIASYNFHVEDFAPPRLEVKVSSKNDYLTPNTEFNADIYARWLFGADGAGLPYKVTWSARAANFEPENPKWKGYSFGDPSRSFKGDYGEIYVDSPNLDNSGKATVKIPVGKNDEDEIWEASTYINVTVRSEVMEDGGRWDSGSITRKYFPSEWLLGIAPANSGKLAVRNNINFKVAAITPDEQPANPGTLNAELFRVTWNYNLIEVDGHKRWQSTEELNKISEKELTLKNGLGSVSFRPEQYGTYLVRISDENDSARAVYRFYADDPKYASSGSQLIDRLEITTDKDSYKPGEKAKIKIKTPFAGMLMVNIEGAKLIERKIHKVDEPEKIFEIDITPEFLPNAWVNAWLIRPVQTSDAKAWGSHRAIGLAKIKMDLSDYEVNVALDAPAQTEPATKLPVTIKLSNNNSNKTDVAIALVDEGVLRLTNYQTPDLLKHFWGEKELNSKGFDIYDQLIPVEDRATQALHPSGGEAMAALAGDSNVQRFKILSLFEGSLTPNKNGELKTELELPEFSGKGRLFAVVASGKNFGVAEQNIQIARDIVTEISLPRFAAPDDEFAVPVTVFNTSKQNRDIEVTFKAEGLTPKATQAKFSLAPNSNKKLSAKLKALNVDSAKLTVVTSWNNDNSNKSFEQEIDLPVRASVPFVTLAGSGMFDTGTTKLTLPFDDFAGKVTGSFTIAKTPAVNVNQASEFLVNYPYGCLEQTISTAFPFLTLPDAISELDPDLLNDDALQNRINNAITRIQSMQLYDGSFAMWQGNSNPYNWGSIYAAHFLLKAKDAGINYPEEMLNGVLNWIKQFLASMPAYNYPEEERDDLTAKAYAVYVLALNGEKPQGWIEYLNENVNNMLPSGKIWLAGAQSIIDGKSDSLRDLTIGNSNVSSWHTLESDTRNTAILLTLWLDVESDAPEVLELANRLVKLGENKEWHSTQDNAWALMSLARFGTEVAGNKSNIKATLTTQNDDNVLMSYSNNKTVKINAQDIPDSDVMIKSQGEGKGCYSWTLTGIPKYAPKPERKGLNIECSYYDSKGDVLDITKPVNQGTIIRAVIYVKPSMPINNLALNYLLPAGFELENPRLDDGDNNSQSGTYGIVNDVRDDRLILFFDSLQQETSYGFRLRAVNKGTFAVPQISAFGMYDSSVRFTGKQQPNLIIK